MKNNVTQQSTCAMQGASNNAAAEVIHLLTENQTADFLRVKKSCLQAWRQRGGGPRYRKVGRLVRYTVEDLRAFLDAGARENTAQDAAQG